MITAGDSGWITKHGTTEKHRREQDTFGAGVSLRVRLHCVGIGRPLL